MRLSQRRLRAMDFLLMLFPIWNFVALLGAYGVGVLLAAGSGFPAQSLPFGLQVLAVSGLYLAAVASREAFPPEPSRCPLLGGLPPRTWHLLALSSLLLAVFFLAILQWQGRSGDLTLPLGALGILAGYFLSAPPALWWRRGLGEFWAALGMGLLPVAAGYYFQAGHFVSEILLYGVPLSLAGFNVFLLLGLAVPGAPDDFPPSGLAARMTPIAAALLYTVMNILLIIALVFNILFPAVISKGSLWLWALVALAVVNQEAVKRRAYREEAHLRLLCLSTYLLHPAMSFLFALGLIGRW